MTSSEMLHRVALARIYDSEERSESIIRVTRIGELGTRLVVTSNQRTLKRQLVTANLLLSSPLLVTLMVEALNSFETSAIARAALRNISEDRTLLSTKC
jgi:hypothetical protein